MSGGTPADPRDSRLVRFGAIVFWTIVACLMVARVMFLDISQMRPGETLSANQPAAADARHAMAVPGDGGSNRGPVAPQ